MSKQELRRRLQAVDPNLKIVSGRRSVNMSIKLLPKLLSNVEAEWWGLPTMLPDFPPEEILFIESKWSKKALQRMAEENFLDPGGDKDLLISKLMYVGALDSQGEVVEKPAEKRVREFAMTLPSTVKKRGGATDPEAVYNESLEAFRKASREFTAIRNAYRTREIGDEEFLRGKKAFDNASQVADAAEKAYIKAKERMPRINPHASAIKQDEQLRAQMRWLKKRGFKTAREAQEAGY